MDLDSAFAFAELGPRKKREAQVDRGRIEGEDCFLELQADVLVVVNSPGFGAEHLREIGIDPQLRVSLALAKLHRETRPRMPMW